MNPNDPAFPCKDVGNLLNPPELPGLTKREYFAALAMQGMLSNVQYSATVSWDELVEQAAKYADALIAELSK